MTTLTLKAAYKPFQLWMVYDRAGICQLKGRAFATRAVALSYIRLNGMSETWYPQRVRVTPW